MKPTDPPSPLGPAEQVPPRRPSGGGGATYRHSADHASSYHDGVHDHALEDDLHNPEVAHEHIDVNVRAIVMSGVTLVVVTIVSHLIVMFLFGWFERESAAGEPPPSPVARPATQMPTTTRESPVFNPTTGVSGPQLLTNEPMALQKQRAEESKRLHGYGWTNEAAGIAHMPIDSAKKLILERGLPVRAETRVAPSLGTRVPASGEASGGRVITVPLPEPPSGAPAQPAAKPHGGH